ncbi:MAG: PepSY domain-containing protein [Bradyrhizobium sp.]|uniref:PepSY domain-containing protein n=1 Tax=Bradyrhizobium sp. TaxID=376 RepID=UPI00271C691F|nr:PepSY domain-containing protein [Bradyrhizobium sp.]MDO8398420.1 PepSY domain-containing protein [Bradyrhizobium sp.]
MRNKLAKRLILLMLPLLPLIAPVSAFGRESADLGSPSVPQSNESESEALLQEIKVFAYAQISARRAIAIAERLGAGARAVDLGFDGSTSHPAYRVKVLLNGELWDGAIDASTGVAVSTGPTTPVSRLREENQTILAAFSAAGIGLSETIAIAERYGSGKTVSAGLQYNGAKLVLLVVVVSEGSLKEISVEPPESRSRRRKTSARDKKWKRPSSGGSSRGVSA